MGRQRKNNPLGLPSRVYEKHGTFFYVHPSGKWERLGTNVAAAKDKGNHYNDAGATYGTMAWYLDQFVIYFEGRVRAGDRSERTLHDYRKAAKELKVFFGHMTAPSVLPSHVNQYLSLGASANRSVRVNREKACLSACFSYIIGQGLVSPMQNPCLRQFGVVRNKETKRTRYPTNAEVNDVKKVAPHSVIVMMDLVYRTLQRPTDVLTWTGEIIHVDNLGQPILRFKQRKTRKEISIAVTGELQRISMSWSKNRTQTFINNGRGRPYTYDGLSSMLRKACRKAGVESFGFRDMKAKGATDMWLDGVPLEKIQLLCGHTSVKTTEIYVKHNWQQTIQPNMVT